MNHKGPSHVGLYLSTLDLDKTREFYEVFWVLISDREPIKIKDGERMATGRLAATAGAARREPGL